MAADPLFKPYDLGDLRLPSRIVMAPMTRRRADAGGIPTALNARYYAQRASAGLIIAEGAQISRQGACYLDTPGLYTQPQIAGWRSVVERVHAAGGRIFAQLWHVGRISHVDLQPDGGAPIAPSAVAAPREVPTLTGIMRTSPPRALLTEEVPLVVEQFRLAAENAKAAGFDGIELHGANGYLIEQFLYSGSNIRDDHYGGSIENRARFLLEIVDACRDVWPIERIGVRLSPQNRFYDMEEADRLGLACYVARAMDHRRLGYLHITEALTGHPMMPPELCAEHSFARDLRQLFSGPLILNGGFDAETASAALSHGLADLVAFGAPFIANPDLPARFAKGAAMNPLDLDHLLTGAERGYTDYPALSSNASDAPD